MERNYLDSLLILNEVERPCMYLICRELCGGKVIYVNEYLRRRYPKLKKDKITTYLMDYGFVFEDGAYKLKNPSKVRYESGQIRKWQGRSCFTYDEIRKFDGKANDEGLV